MDLLNNLLIGFQSAVTLTNLLYCFVGVSLGTLVGVLPGMGPVATVAMLLPITYALDPSSALIMLAGIYYGAQYGGSTTAILVNIPGEAAAVVTCLDGHKLAKLGRAGAALGVAAFGSFIAGCFATVLIAAFAEPLTLVAFEFGPREYFSLMVLGLVGAVVLASGSLLKAIGMIFIGILLGCVGMDVNSGALRYVFGVDELMDGLDFVALSMGVYGFAEIIRNLDAAGSREAVPAAVGKVLPSAKDLKESAGAISRGTILGSLLGILPGGGALLSSFASYTLEKKLAGKNARPPFGEGNIRGVAGPESANNAGAQTSFIPMLTLGIERRDGTHDRRPDAARHCPGPAGHDDESLALLGPHRLHVDRERLSRNPQHSAHRPLGEAPARALPAPLPGDSRLLHNRRLFDQQQPLRHLDHDRIRHLRVDRQQARVRVRAAHSRLHPRADA